MKLTVLGYKGGYPSNGVGTSSYLLESEGYHLLIDVGSGALLSLEKHLDPLELDAVLLSHYHYDHITDVGSLQQTRKLKRSKKGRVPLLPIYAHTDSEFFSLLSKDNATEGIAYDEEEQFDIGPFRVTKMETLHPVRCYAFRIEERNTGKVMVYTADSGYKEEFISFSEHADLLVADTNFFEGMERHSVHMTAPEVGRIGREAEVSKILLTHLPHEGDLKLLKQQAMNEAPGIEVVLAEKDLILTI